MAYRTFVLVSRLPVYPFVNKNKELGYDGCCFFFLSNFPFMWPVAWRQLYFYCLGRIAWACVGMGCIFVQDQKKSKKKNEPRFIQLFQLVYYYGVYCCYMDIFQSRKFASGNKLRFRHIFKLAVFHPLYN